MTPLDLSHLALSPREVRQVCTLLRCAADLAQLPDGKLFRFTYLSNVAGYLDFTDDVLDLAILLYKLCYEKMLPVNYSCQDAVEQIMFNRLEAALMIEEAYSCDG